MATPGWFEDVPVLGKMPPAQAAAKLRELGDTRTASVLESAHDASARDYGLLKSLWPFQDKPWQHTAHAFGFLAPDSSARGLLPIQHPGALPVRDDLKNARVKITLNGLRVAAYPGGGTHRILFDFYARNQLANAEENLHFNATYRVKEGERAAVIGFPVFVGLNVGSEGVAFKCFTVNVKNDQDEAVLGFFESDVFRGGLKLVNTLQPAIAPLSHIAFSLTNAIASRNRNVPVQDFYMGLDFGNNPTGARLAEGSYLAVQIPEKLQTVWDWSEWGFNKSNGQVVNHVKPTELIPYNYIVFGVSRYDGP